MKNLFQKFFGVLSKNSTQKDRTRRNVEIGRHLRQKVKGFDPRRFGRALYDHDETEFELESRNKILDIKDDLIGLTSYQKMNKIIVALGEERRTSFPILGRYYTFKYSPTTKQDKWDALPLVVCINYLSRDIWVGLNFHWDELRNYKLDGIRSGMYEVYEEELQDLIEIGYMQIEFDR